jgi:hypothetical protein
MLGGGNTKGKDGVCGTKRVKEEIGKRTKSNPDEPIKSLPNPNSVVHEAQLMSAERRLFEAERASDVGRQ